MAEEIIMMQPNKTFTTEFRGVRYDYYLTGYLGDPENYLDLCNILRTASSQDEVVIRFNSGGGQVRTGNQIINAIRESDANVIGFIEHDCGSMCTFIFLACRNWGVSPYAEWFSHTVSGGNYGKESETFEASQFLRKQTHSRLREEYRSFLTEEEIEGILKGSDVYLNSEEIMERLESYSEYRESQPCNCGQPGCESAQDGEEGESFEEMHISLEDMIAQAVENGVKKALSARDKAEAKKAKKPVAQPDEAV